MCTFMLNDESYHFTHRRNVVFWRRIAAALCSFRSAKTDSCSFLSIGDVSPRLPAMKTFKKALKESIPYTKTYCVPSSICNEDVQKGLKRSIPHTKTYSVLSCPVWRCTRRTERKRYPSTALRTAASVAGAAVRFLASLLHCR